VRLVFLGPPGVGKGTHSKFIADKLGVPYYSTGDIFRDVISKGNPLSKEIERYVNAGELLPDKVVFEIISEKISEKASKRGWVLDGYPRTREQAELLDEFLSERNEKLDYAVYLYADTSTLINRLSNRRVCPVCKAVYNTVTDPPEKEGVCDICGSELIIREDDQPDVIKNRIEIFKKEFKPLEEYYKGTGVLLSVSGEGELGEVRKQIEERLNIKGGSNMSKRVYSKFEKRSDYNK